MKYLDCDFDNVVYFELEFHRQKRQVQAKKPSIYCINGFSFLLITAIFLAKFMKTIFFLFFFRNHKCFTRSLPLKIKNLAWKIKKKVSRFWPILDECIFPNVSPNTYNHCFYLLFATMRYFSFDCPVWQCWLWSFSLAYVIMDAAGAASAGGAGAHSRFGHYFC